MRKVACLKIFGGLCDLLTKWQVQQMFQVYINEESMETPIPWCSYLCLTISIPATVLLLN